MAWTDLTAGDTDVGSPGGKTLMDKIRNNLDFLEAVAGQRYRIPLTRFMSVDWSSYGILLNAGDNDIEPEGAIVVNVDLPYGYTATAVRLNTKFEGTISIYEVDLRTGTAGTEVTGGTDEDITIDIEMSEYNFIEITLDAVHGTSQQHLYGGYVVVERA